MSNRNFKVMKHLIFISLLVISAISASAQSYKTDPVYQQHYRQYQQRNAQRNYRVRIQAIDTPQQQTYTQPQVTKPTAVPRTQMDYNFMMYQQMTGKKMKKPGDYFIASGRWEKATFWTTGLGLAAAGGLYYYSTTSSCKDQKAFRTAAIATAGVTAVLAFTFWMTKIHYKIKAGKALNIGVVPTGAELTYNF